MLSNAHSKYVTVDPLQPSRNVIEIFLLGLSFWTGVQLIMSNQAPIDTPFLVAWLWRIMLVAGPILIGTGMVWWGRAYTGLAQQQVGYTSLGFGALAFGSAAVNIVIIVFGVFCLMRSWQIAGTIERYLPGTSLLWRVWRWLK